MRNTFLGACLAGLCACGLPDISKEIDGYRGAVSTADAALTAQFVAQAEAEDSAARQATIDSFSKVYSSPSVCRPLADGRLDYDPSACKLLPAYQIPTERGSGVYSLDALAVLKAYGLTLDALVKSKAPTEIAAEFGNLISATNTFAEAASKIKGKTVIAKDKIKPISGLAGKLSEQARARAIRSLIIDAHEPLREVLAELVASQSKRDGLSDLMTELNKSWTDMETARDKRSPTLPTEVARYEAAFAAYKTASASSMTAKLAAIWKQQELLYALARKPGDLKGLVEILEDIKAISEG
jgi:hypothetical protein